MTTRPYARPRSEADDAPPRRRRAVAGTAAALVAAAMFLPGAAAAAPGGPAEPALASEPATAPVSAAAEAERADSAAAQVLTWTADNSVTEYSSAPAEAVAGPATIVFDNSVQAGNTLGMSHTLTFDTSTPGYNHDVALDILANPFDANGGVHTAEVVLTPGTYRYFCAIPGHGTMVGELVVTDGGGGDPGDTTPPTVTAEVTGERDAQGNYIGAATVTLSASDDSGSATVEYALDGAAFQAYTEPIRLTEPGTHEISYRASDAAGNVSETGSVTVVVAEPQDPGDTTPPTVTAEVTGERDAQGNYVGAATVTLSASDDSGSATIEYALAGGAFQAYTEPIRLTEPGMHMVAYRARDAAGNVSEEGMAHVVVVEADGEEDTTPPQVSAQVTGELDDSGAYVGAARVALSATDDSGSATTEYALDGSGYRAYDGAFDVTAPGEHTVEFRATDAAGNDSGVRSVTFTVVEAEPDDTTPPTVRAEVTGEQDADGAYLGSATVSLTASDDTAVASVEYDLDGAGFTEYTDPIRIDAPGAHTVSYRATDEAGNVSETGTVEVEVVEVDEEPDDVTPPFVTADLSGEQDADGAYVGGATVEISAIDDESEVAGIVYSLDEQPYVAYEGPFTVTEPGAHMLRYRATDTAGNTSSSQSLPFLVARTELDACPASDERETVVIGDVDSGVPNVDAGDGCTVADLLDTDEPFPNRGAFLGHVRDVVDDLVERGVLERKQGQVLVRTAARSDIAR